MIRPAHWLLLLAAGLAFSHSVSAQSLTRGSVLISTESLAGTMFERTVMLIVHHDEDGTIGIMINRPTTLQPAEVFPDITGAQSYDGVLYFGGPLAPARPFLLTRSTDGLQDSGIRIIDDVFLNGDLSVLDMLADDRRAETFARIYAGSAQWGPGQLQSEVNAGAWEATRGSASLIFSNDPVGLWSRVVIAPPGNEIAQVQAD
jgi:putative transcriptional regulator